jgi:hypothetical protein
MENGTIYGWICAFDAKNGDKMTILGNWVCEKMGRNGKYRNGGDGTGRRWRWWWCGGVAVLMEVMAVVGEVEW